jgi:glutaredoxin-like YruB-family protein
MVSVQLLFGALVAVCTLSGCDELSSLFGDAVARTESEAPPSTELAIEKANEALPERPATSMARSETEVISFRSVLENTEMTREERIRAFQKLDPAALQKPVARSNVSGGPPRRDIQRRATRSEPTDWELAAARRRVPVVMYSTAWCGVCRRARQYFEQKGIAFVEHDVDDDPRAREEYLRLNPRRSVPTIKVGDEVVVGFSALAVERALDASARARL